ncbi:MAG: ferredoxin--NADP reductase [Polaribacter sp.]|uniref:ferredoxin--NADP reductase n=1 Tax=Polaribacter sp. TaxID=1920175 RepID=UPI0032665196
MKLLVKNIVKETNDAISIHLKNGNFFKKIKYKPGQFLTIKAVINEEDHKRAYSFSSNPHTDKDLKITVKRVENGLVSNYLCDSLKVGDSLTVDPAAGSFFVSLDKKEKKQYVLFAGGSGITPMFSIIKSVLSEEKDSKILLIYANQSIASIIFHDEIKNLEKEYSNNFFVEHIIANNKKEEKNYHSGLATKELIDRCFLKHKLTYTNHVYRICGPFGYMEKVKEILSENNISREQIKLEVFKMPKVKVTGKNFVSDVTLKFEGKEHTLKFKGDKSILQQAMAHNISLPYSCRSGMCSTCKAKCIEGEVKMTEGHILSENEQESGSVLTCISYPTSEKIVIEI